MPGRRRWLIAVLLLAGCSEEAAAPRPEAQIDQALRRERPGSQLQQVKRIEIEGKPAFCGTTSDKKRPLGSRPVPVQAFLYRDGAFVWPDASPEAAAEFAGRCQGMIADERTNLR